MKKDQVTNFLAAVAAGIIIAGASIFGMSLANQYNQDKFIETLHYEIQMYNERQTEHMSNAEQVQHMNEMGMMLYQLGN